MTISAPTRRMEFTRKSELGRYSARFLPAALGRTAVIVAVLTCLTCQPRNANAQLAGGGLNNGGYAIGGTSLRDTVTSLQSGPPASTNLPWTIGGDVDLEVGATDSPGGIGRSNWQPVILVAPDLIVNGVTSRVNVALVYSPRLAFYPSTSGQTLLSQSFNGSANAVLIPDLFYVSVRGISDLSSRFGNTSLLSNSFVSRDEAVQTTSLSISPYLQRDFGGYGTATAGYTYAQTFQDSDNGFAQTYFAPNSAQTAGFGATGNLQTNTEFGSFTTGENLGRIQNTISATASQFSGSYFYQGASTLSVTDRLSYVVYRWLTVFGTVGYEEYNYPRSGYNLSEPTWTVGGTLTPNETSSLTLQYGQVAGINTILANATFSPTPRTRVFGSYTVDIETGLGARQGLLGSTTVGPGGLLLSNLTGAPTLSNTYLASQYPLSRVKTATIGGSLLLDRDTFTVTVVHSELDQLGGSVSILGVGTQPGTHTSSTYGTLNWQHDLNPLTSLSSGISYATSDNGVYFGAPGTSQNVIQAYTSLNHNFTDTLSGSVSYSHSERSGAATQNLPAAYGGSASQNTLLVGMRKSF